MSTVFFDAPMGDDARRERLYDGDFFVFSPQKSAAALCWHARDMIERAFGTVDPRKAQYAMPVEAYVAIGAQLKPAFIHHPRTKELIRNILAEMGCDLQKTYLDVPRLRMQTSDGYLTSGVGYQLHPHRDTWYSAPTCQLNWWIPIYEIAADNGMAFHPRYFREPVANTSAEFNYYLWNSDGRTNAARHIKTDTRKQPRALEPLQLEPDVRPVCPPGGIILFSPQHLHSTVPNTSGVARYSLDFRTVHVDDVAQRRSAPNVDAKPSGTSLRDFLRAADLAPLPDELVAAYDTGVPAGGTPVFKPTGVGWYH